MIPDYFLDDDDFLFDNSDNSESPDIISPKTNRAGERVPRQHELKRSVNDLGFHFTDDELSRIAIASIMASEFMATFGASY